MVTNPFTFGKPIRDPKRFYGREREIRQIVGRLLSAFESTAVVGERRIGKTSLLLHLADRQVAANLGLAPEQYVTVYVDFQGCTDITPVRFWSRVLDKLARKLADKELAVLAKDMKERSEIDQYDLEDLFMELDERGLQLVLLMDEFEYVTQNANFGLDFFAGLRALAIHCPLALITATRQELVDLCHSDAIKGSPFFNIFASVVLRPFSQEEVMALIDGALEGTSVTFSEAGRACVSETAGGHPLFTQMAGYYCFEGHQMGLEGEALQRHIEENFREQATPHFAYLWSHSDESERITLLALLALARRKKKQSVREQLVKVYPRADYILPDLLKRGLAIERDGQFNLFSPIFADWLLLEMSVGASDEAGEQTVQEWLQVRGGIDRGVWDQVKGTFPKFKQRYWPLFAEFLQSASVEVVTDIILNLSR
jgi:hypothetical protein